MRNGCFKSSKLNARVFRQILRLFALDLTASDCAPLTGVSVCSVNDIYLRLRERLARECEKRRPIRSGEVAIDESYFWPRRVRGKRGRGAGGKAIVFGIFKREGKVYTEIVPDCSKRSRLAVIRGRIKPEVIVHSEGWRGYDGLVDVGYEKHLRIQHGRNQFARGKSHINGIESFWGFAKRRLAKFNGVPSHTFTSKRPSSDSTSVAVSSTRRFLNCSGATRSDPQRPSVCFLSPHSHRYDGHDADVGLELGHRNTRRERRGFG